MSRSLTVRYALLGLLLSLGAPLGWLVVRTLGGHAPSVAAELEGHVGLYLYLDLATGIVLTLVGGAIGQLIARLKEANAQLEQRAITDGLTRLRNHAYFQERLVAECARADRDGAPFSLIAIDLDRFKEVNDRFGHATGDLVLAATGEVITRCMRLGDVACRVGGEEFAVICLGATLDEGLQVAERIRAALESHSLETQGAEVRITASFGVAERTVGLSPLELARAADSALYDAKRAGRNQVRFDEALQRAFQT